MKKKAWIILAGAMWCSAVCTHAASISVESFDESMNDWTNAAGTLVWRVTNGAATAVFAASPVPASAVLVVTGGVKGAAFTGDYAAAGIEMIGFRFRAEHVPPSTLTIRMRSGTNGYFRALQSAVPATGVWYRFVIPVESKAAGSWDGDPAEQFEDVLAAVDEVAITVIKPSTLSPSRYQVDDIVIDRLHAPGAIHFSTGITAAVEARYLQPDAAYTLESSPAPDGVWSAVGSFIATGRYQSVATTNIWSGPFIRVATP